MLPDFAGMTGDRLGPVSDPILAAGVAFHHRTDAAFHRAEVFIDLLEFALSHLEHAGLPRGPARAVGHVGTELLLDGLLATDSKAVTAYRGALSIASQMKDLHMVQSPNRIAALSQRLSNAPLPEAYASPVFVAERLRLILGGRPRLRIEEAQLPEITICLNEIQSRLRRDQARLMDYMRQQLTTA